MSNEDQQLRADIDKMGQLARDLFEQQFRRCGGRKPADPTWDDLEQPERDEWWERALDAAPLLAAKDAELERAVMEEALRWRSIVEQWERGHQNDVLPYTAKLEADVDLLSWLHAESAWRLATERQQRWDHVLNLLNDTQHAEEENDGLRREVKRLRREVEFEANGANTFAGADAVAERGEVGAAFVAEDFGLDVDYEAGGVYVSLNHSPVVRTETWGDDVNVDYDADGTPTGVEILRPPARPVCAVHLEEGQGEIRAVPWTEEDAAAFEAQVRADGGEA